MSSFTNLKKAHPVEISFEAEGESVTLVFDRNAMTQNWVLQIQEARERDDIRATAQGLADLILSWDVVDDDGSPVPASTEILGELPLAVLSKLDEALSEAAMPTSEEGNVSSATSPTPSTDSTPQLHEMALRPNGQEPSSLPVPSASPSPT